MAGLRFLDVKQDRKDIFWKWSGSDMLVAISLLTAAHWAVRGLSANDVRHRSLLDQRHEKRRTHRTSIYSADLSKVEEINSTTSWSQRLRILL
jgi:hypothetical protein